MCSKTNLVEIDEEDEDVLDIGEHFDEASFTEVMLLWKKQGSQMSCVNREIGHSYLFNSKYVFDTLSQTVEIQTDLALLRKFTNNSLSTKSVFAKCRKNTFFAQTLYSWVLWII